MQVEQYYSDDYAGLNAGKFSFYYGYEETDVKNDSWCFVVKENGREIFRKSEIEIKKNIDNRQLDDVRDYLIAGIGMWLLLK